MGAEGAAEGKKGQGFWSGLWEDSWAQKAVQGIQGFFRGGSADAQVNPYAVEGKGLSVPFLSDIPIVGGVVSLDLTALGINGETMSDPDTWAKMKEAIAFGALTGNKDIEGAVKALEGKASGIIGGAIGSFVGPLGMLAGYFGSGFVLTIVGMGFEAFGQKNPFAPGYLARFLVDDEAKAAALAQAQKMGAVVSEAEAGASAGTGAEPGVSRRAQLQDAFAMARIEGPAAVHSMLQKIWRAAGGSGRNKTQADADTRAAREASIYLIGRNPESVLAPGF